MYQEHPGHHSASGNVSKIFWAMVWIMVLIFIAWPVCYMMVDWYVFLIPFSYLICPNGKVWKYLELVWNFPRTCVLNAKACEPIKLH
ncbi:unnamed protein product [Gordionus sp. m RMFG-2023]